MPREYRHIEQYEKEISELQEQGLTQRQIGERLGFRREQIKEFIRRKREKDRKIAAGIAFKKKGRPAKDSVVTEEDRANSLHEQIQPFVLFRACSKQKTIIFCLGQFLFGRSKNLSLYL